MQFVSWISFCDSETRFVFVFLLDNLKFFLIRILPYLDWLRRFTSYISAFSPNMGKYGPEKTPYLDSFHAVGSSLIISHRNSNTIFIEPQMTYQYATVS